MPTDKIHDLIIVGGGPGGLSAGIYAARARLDVLLLEKGASGGQILITEWVDNYPGFPEGINGNELAEKFLAQTKRFGLEPRYANVTSMDLAGPVKKLFLENGDVLKSRTVIISTGARPNKLNVPGEDELTGKGVSYCATCDGPFYRDQEIAVVGGGDTAVEEAVYLTKFASKVTIIHRRDELRAVKIIQEQAFANEKVHFLCDSEVVAIEGDNEVQSLKLLHTDGSESHFKVQGVFILIGTTPNNEMLPLDQLKNDNGFVVTDCMMQTNLDGVFAIGDIRHHSIRQIVTAAGDGAVAEKAAEMFLQELSQTQTISSAPQKCSEAQRP